MKNYKWVDGRLICSPKSWLHWIFMRIPMRIGYYECVRVGREVWNAFHIHRYPKERMVR